MKKSKRIFIVSFNHGKKASVLWCQVLCYTVAHNNFVIEKHCRRSGWSLKGLDEVRGAVSRECKVITGRN